MAELHKTAASLRFFGDDLDPEEITHRLGGTPTVEARKGGIWLTPNGTEVLAHTGKWRLKVERRSPGDLNGQVAELFASLTTDLSIWNDLSNRFRGNVFGGLFLNEVNEGYLLTPYEASASVVRWDMTAATASRAVFPLSFPVAMTDRVAA